MNYNDFLTQNMITAAPECFEEYFERTEEYDMYFTGREFIESVQHVFDAETYLRVCAAASDVRKSPAALRLAAVLNLALKCRSDCEHVKFSYDPSAPVSVGMAAFFAILDFLPSIEQRMAALGIPQAVIDATLSSGVGGSVSVRGFDANKLFSWMQYYIDIKLMRVGILNFELRDKGYPDFSDMLEPNEPVIAVHIPSGIRLTPENCDAAYSECARIVRECFPEFKFRAFSCHSWMMDEQLKSMLPEQSNIIKFQSRFTTFKTGKATDSVFMFVFGCPGGVIPDISELPEDTSLRRAIKAHLIAGGRIYADGGLIFGY